MTRAWNQETVTRHPRRSSLLTAALTLLLLPATQPAAADTDRPDGYLRIVEGDVQLSESQDGYPGEAYSSQPLLVGDRLELGRDARAEAVLPNGLLLRLGARTDLSLLELGGSSWRDASPSLRLEAGEIQLVLRRSPRRGESPRIETENATIHLHRRGSYLIRAGRGPWTEITVREGYAEVETERASEIVRDKELAWIEGDRRPRPIVEAALSRTALERWGERLDRAALAYDDRFDEDWGGDDSLRYAASSLHEHGRWIVVDGARAWRPSVNVGWRPYTDGHWYSTPRGLSWVSYEPWGWVPYHYGSWDHHDGYGWVWYPGRRWATAWVYWYWTPSYVGWCPTGYYARHYRFDHDRFHFGVWGSAHGDRRHFANWNFLPTDRLLRRGRAADTRPSHGFGDRDGRERLGRGLITTDTRGITREVLEKPEEAVRVLSTRPGTRREKPDEVLPDLTPMLERRPLPTDVRRRIAEKPAEVTPAEGSDDGFADGRPEPRPRLQRVPRADKPADETPTYARPTYEKPTEEKPSEEKPAERQPRLQRVEPRNPEPREPRRTEVAPRTSRPAETKPPELRAVEPAKPAEKPAEGTRVGKERAGRTRPPAAESEDKEPKPPRSP
jgi:hypothetical protein